MEYIITNNIYGKGKFTETLFTEKQTIKTHKWDTKWKENNLLSGKLKIKHQWIWNVLILENCNC